MTDLTKDQEIAKQTRALLWNIVHQGEKVHGSLKTLIDLLFPGYPEEHKFMMLEKVKAKIK